MRRGEGTIVSAVSKKGESRETAYRALFSNYQKGGNAALCMPMGKGEKGNGKIFDRKGVTCFVLSQEARASKGDTA